MKSATKQSPYISAYPLKALEQAAAKAGESNQSPYLRSILAGKTRSLTRLRVSPMANPYPANMGTLPLRPRIPSEDITSEGRDWFNHYE